MQRHSSTTQCPSTGQQKPDRRVWNSDSSLSENSKVPSSSPGLLQIRLHWTHTCVCTVWSISEGTHLSTKPDHNRACGGAGKQSHKGNLLSLYSLFFKQCSCFSSKKFYPVLWPGFTVFTYDISDSSQSLLGQELLSPFYRRENWGSKRWGAPPIVIEPALGGA